MYKKGHSDEGDLNSCQRVRLKNRSPKITLIELLKKDLKIDNGFNFAHNRIEWWRINKVNFNEPHGS